MDSAALIAPLANSSALPLHHLPDVKAESDSLQTAPDDKRRVRFPSDDVVTSYIDPPVLWPRDAAVPSSQDVLGRYIDACVRYNTRPLQKLTDQLVAVDLASQRWAPALSLRGEKLDAAQVESMEEVLKWIRFRIFDISDTMLDDESATALFDMLEFYDGVENLNISGQKQLTERGWSACARLIRRAVSLQALYIRHCSLDSQALRYIGRSLQLGSLLSEIHLERSSIGGAGLAHLVAGARSSVHLKRLHLSGCRLGPSDGTHIGILLRQSRSLEILDVEDNLLQDSGCMQVLSGLAANRDTKLMDLRFGTNQLTAQAANAIAYALVSAPIRYLHVARNNIGTEGILGMRDGMLRCSLKHIDLSETRLSCEAAIALAEIAVESRTLQSIDLRGNPIRTAGVMALGLAARMNQNITSIEIDRARAMPKAGHDNSAVEDLLTLVLELDRQLSVNRETQQEEPKKEVLEADNEKDTDSLKGLIAMDNENASSEHPEKTDAIETFFGNDDNIADTKSEQTNSDLVKKENIDTSILPINSPLNCAHEEEDDRSQESSEDLLQIDLEGVTESSESAGCVENVELCPQVSEDVQHDKGAKTSAETTDVEINSHAESVKNSEKPDAETDLGDPLEVEEVKISDSCSGSNSTVDDDTA